MKLVYLANVFKVQWQGKHYFGPRIDFARPLKAPVVLQTKRFIKIRNSANIQTFFKIMFSTCLH